MGSHTFRWEQPAEEVFVTGSFDNWTKSVKLDKKDAVHEKMVAISDITHPLSYKYFVDGVWQYDSTKKIEPDHEGNLNNILYPEEMDPPNSQATQTITTVAPGATTLGLAGQQPLESKSDEVPGTFPDTPAADAGAESKGDGLLAGAAAAGVAALAAVRGTAAYLTDSSTKEEQDQTVSVNPIPASEGSGNPIHLAPGEPVPAASTINDKTITSAVHDDPSLKSSAKEAEQTFAVAPIPASGGIGNPVQLQPGEKVPDSTTVSGNTLTSNVKLDKESYEKSDAAASQLPAASSPQSGREAEIAPILGLGPQTTNLIPESSMGMGNDAPAPLEGAAISSVGANSTTNELAGKVPLEPRGVPEVVSESQKEAQAAPEASANPVAVEEKKEVENELKAKVPEEQASSENKTGIYAAVAGGVAAGGAAVASATGFAREKAQQTAGTDPVSVLPASVQKSIDGINQESNASAAPAVPEEVKESQKEAHVSPEASANPEAVKEKQVLEDELLKKVPESQAQGEPAPTETAALSAVAPTTSASGAPQLADPVGGGLAPITIDEKPAESAPLNAPADAPAQTPATKAQAADRVPQDSRDVSPMSRPAGGTQQTESGSASTPVGTPRKNAPGTSSGTKRNSIMDRLKGTPGSSKTEDGEGKKKKGFIARLKEKFKS